MISAAIRPYVYGAFVLLAILAMLLLLAFCHTQDQARQAKAEAQTANATGKALDNVTTQTSNIQTDTTEKQREVDEIQGSDVLLPDGYGSRLECVRRGGERCNP